MAPQSELDADFEEDSLMQKSSEPELVTDRELSINVVEMYHNLKNFDYSTVIWRNVLAMVIIHILAFRGLLLVLTGQFKWASLAVFAITVLLIMMGTTMGAHRLWAHRSYKATLPLRIFLALCQTMAWQRDVYDWVRDHRVHHKFSETDADPHNARRGLFFAHMGWLMCQKHPEVIAKGKKVDYSDIFADPVVMFQRKYYIPLSAVLSLVIPCFVPWYYFGESISRAFYIIVMLRYVATLHVTWCVNSFSHWVGNRPFDGYIYPAQNKWVSLFSGGEGWHNYHHAFPYDYRAAELGGFMNLNHTASFIKWCALIGLAYDLRIPSDEAIKRKSSNKGDGTFAGIGVSN